MVHETQRIPYRWNGESQDRGSTIEGEFTTMVMDKITGAVDKAKEVAEGALAQAKEAAEGALSTAKEAAEGAVDKAKEAADRLKPGQ